MKSKQIGKQNSDSSFAELLEANLENRQETKPGTPVQARIVSTRDKDFVFVNTPLGAGVIQRLSSSFALGTGIASHGCRDA